MVGLSESASTTRCRLHLVACMSRCANLPKVPGRSMWTKSKKQRSLFLTFVREPQSSKLMANVCWIVDQASHDRLVPIGAVGCNWEVWISSLRISGSSLSAA